jgi:hypothetical protein
VALLIKASAQDPAAQASCDGLLEIVGVNLACLNQFQRHARVLPLTHIRYYGGRGPTDPRKTLAATIALTGTVRKTAASFHWVLDKRESRACGHSYRNAKIGSSLAARRAGR